MLGRPCRRAWVGSEGCYPFAAFFRVFLDPSSRNSSRQAPTYFVSDGVGTPRFTSASAQARRVLAVSISRSSNSRRGVTLREYLGRWFRIRAHHRDEWMDTVIAYVCDGCGAEVDVEPM